MNSAVLFALGTTFTWGLWLVLADLTSGAVGSVTAAAITYAVAAGLFASIGLAVVSIVLISR